jgi:hypothetical protein
MLLYLSDDVASAPLPSHLAPGVRRYSAIALRLGGRLYSLGGHLQVLSLTMRLHSRHQRAHFLRCRMTAILPLPLSPPLNFLVLEDAP